jgi:DNA end-binding protein Ku
MWKGVLEVADDSVPVKFYAAASDRTVRFRLLDRESGRRVRQRMVRPDTGAEVPREEVRRGWPLPGGGHVVFEDSELEEIQPEKSRSIRVREFVPPTAIDHLLYRRPYHLGPDGDREGYFALVEVLRTEGLQGVAEWTMRNTRYVGALGADAEHLTMVTLRNADEIVDAASIDPPAGREPDAREIRMADQLVEALSDDFDATAFRDEYRDRVLEFIEARARGENVRFPRSEVRPRPDDLTDTLEASLAELRERRSA